jgi:hypothetical protein
MRLLYTHLPKLLQCQGCSRSILSGMRPVCTNHDHPPPPRVFAEVFILKTLKVDCFYRFTQVFILKDLIAPICTKIVQVS